MANLIVLVLVRFFHNLFTVMWIGGMLMLAICVMPAIRKNTEKPGRSKLLSAIQQRVNKIVGISILGLFVTGVLMSNFAPLFQGYLSIANQYSFILTLKHVTVGLMIIITFLRNWLTSAKKTKEKPGQPRITAILLIVNLFLGLVVLLLSGWTAALTSILASSS